MPDPFDAIQQTNAATQEAAAAPRDVFTEINGRADPLRATAYLGSKMAPERAAKVIALRDRTGLPADLVDRNLDEVEQQAKSADFNPDQYRKTSPKVAAWLAQQPEHYAISADDLPRLAALERFVSESPEYAWDKDGAVLGAMQGNNRTYYRSTADLLRDMQRQNNLAIVDDVQRRMRAERAQDRGAFSAGFLTAGGSTLRLAQSVGDALTGQDRASGTARQVAQIGEASQINDPGFMADVQRGLGGLTADLPLMLAGSALAPLTTLRGIMGASRFGRIGAGVAATAIAVQPLAIREGILTGQDEGWANGLTSWGIETVIPAAFGTTGTEKIITSLLARGVAKEAAPSLSRVAGRLLLDAGLEGTEEAVTELAHALHEVGSGINPAALDPDQLWPRLAVAGSVGAIAGGGFNLPGAITSLSSRGTLDRDANRLIQAASGQQILAGVIQAAQESTTAGRSPEAARTLYQSMLNDKVPQVYLDREAWDQHFLSLNQDPRAKAAELMGDGAKAYDEAARTGAPLTLQTGRLAVDVAKDKATGEWITREARLDPGMMNAREAEEAVKELETLPDDPEQKLQQTAQEAAQAVLDDVEQQLTAAGYDAGSARRSATQMAAVFRTMAARWNAGRKADDPNRTDARQLFMEWNVGINRPVPEVLAQPTRETADQILAARRAKIADAQLATIDAGRMAAQQATDQALAQQAAGDTGFKLIQEATATLEDVGGQMTTGDAMRALGAAFGFRPDANAPMTPEQAARGNLLAAALRVRGKTLADLIRDAGAARPDPVATTAAGAQAENSPELEKLTADAFQLETLVTAIRAGRGDLAELEQAAALAAEVGPVLESLKLDQARTDSIRSAVEFAQDGQTLDQPIVTRDDSLAFDDLLKQWRKANGDRTPVRGSAEWNALVQEAARVDAANGRSFNQPAYHGTGNSQPYDRFAYDKVGGPGGEGAQAYGWGLYFAGKKEVAEHYKKALSAGIVTYDGKRFDRQDPTHAAALALFDSGGDRAAAKTLLEIKGDRGYAVASDAIAVLEAKKEAKRDQATGRVYTVEIPDDDTMLDWDKPLEKQPEGIRKILKDAGIAKQYKENLSDFASPQATRGRSKLGGSVYEFLAWKTGSPMAASDKLRELGIPGIRYKAGQIANAPVGGGTNYVIFDDSKVSIKSYEQRKDKRRGSITFGRQNGQRQTDIRLFEHTDLSTVLHESGHLYLEMLVDLAGRDGAPQDIKDDLATAMAWMGVTDPAKITVDQHEQWARGFEAYLLEGKAPSAELRGVFARFAAWMAAIYKSVKNLSVNLSPEVRGVFDRLLATQEEIADAATSLGDDPLFADAKAAGMSDADFATYQKAREDARRMAEDDLRTQAMAEITRERTAAWKELRTEVGQEVESETNRAKEYVAESILRRGELPGGVPLPPNIPAIKLDSVDLRRRIDNRLGTDAERKAGMKRMAMMHTRESGIPVDQAATLLGFDSGDALLRALLTLRPRKELIEAETDQRMRARFGDMLTDGSIAEKAMASLHNERRADVHLAEVRALAARVGKKVAPIEVLREAAKRKIDATPAKDLLPSLYARAESKARRALEKALAKQDFPAAWNAKQTELLNHELYRAAIDAKREADEIQAYAKKFNEDKTRKRIGKAGGWEYTVTYPDGRTADFPNVSEAKAAAEKVPGSRYDETSSYLIQIDALLERYEFRRVTNKAIDRRQSLREWAAIQQAAGATVNLPPEVLNDAQKRNWRQAPLAELRGVRDALAHIAHLAKTKNQLTKAQRERELDQLAGTLRDTLARTHPKQNVPDAGSKASWGPAFIAYHRKAANIARVMDGDEDAGPFWDALIRPMNEAADAEAVRLREAKDKQEAIWKRWEQEAKGDGWKTSERRAFAGFKGGLDRLGAIMVALNWGNEGNRNRLMEGGQGLGKITEPQVQAVLDSLNAADWNLVEDIWSHVDSYWSDIKALEQRATGVAPAKVAASPFPTKNHGTIKGGYFPITYDGQETGRIIVGSDDASGAEQAKQMMALSFGRTQTAHGHTKERTIGQGRRLSLDPGVIGQHLTKVIHDLTHREALADTMRILLHEDVRGAIDSRMGSATTKALRQWIADIATGGQMPDAVARGISLARRGFSISTMGFKATTAALQLTGFSNSAVRVGPARMAKAIATLYSAKDGTTAWAFVPSKSTMMAERERTQTREINEILGQFQRGKFATFQAMVGKYAFWMLQKVQSFVDRATWLAAYEKAIDEGHADELAVSIADQTVLDTQSGGQTKDLAGVQRSPYAQILTGAYTYGSLVFNQVYDQGAKISRNPKDFATWAGALGNMMLATAIPTIGSVLLRSLTRDDWPDEKDGIAKRLGIEFASTILGSTVLVRELGGMFSGFDYSGPGVTKPFADLTKLGNQAMQGDLDVGLLRAVINATGSAFGLPSSQAWAMGAGAVEWLENPSPDIRPIIFGPPPRR